MDACEEEVGGYYKMAKALLDVKPYEEIHIDQYLELLNDAMSFFIPSQDFSYEKIII